MKYYVIRQLVKPNVYWVNKVGWIDNYHSATLYLGKIGALDTIKRSRLKDCEIVRVYTPSIRM